MTAIGIAIGIGFKKVVEGITGGVYVDSFADFYVDENGDNYDDDLIT